jgi:ABC-type multidrug transport system fused ATPase/permease subunit
MSYFEIRAAGQMVARMRELETIRSFLDQPWLFTTIDLFFTIVFIVILIAYSWELSLIVLFSTPLYLLIAAIVRPSTPPGGLAPGSRRAILEARKRWKHAYGLPLDEPGGCAR